MTTQKQWARIKARYLREHPEESEMAIIESPVELRGNDLERCIHGFANHGCDRFATPVSVDAGKVWEALCEDPNMPTVPNKDMITAALRRAGYKVTNYG